MYLIVVISIILIIFATLFVLVWSWFFKNELQISERFYKLGCTAFETQNYKRAKSLFEKALNIGPSNLDALFMLCKTHFKMKEYESVETGLNQLIKNNPKNFDAVLLLAKAYLKLSKLNEAEEAYKNALKLNEKCYECNCGLGSIKFESQEFEEALTYFEAAKELFEGENSEIDFYIARCYDELCDYEDETKIGEIINKYLELESKASLPPEFNITLAKAYSKIGEVESAEKYCNKAIALNPEDSENYKLLSVIQLIKKDYSSAKTNLTTGLKLHPKDEEMKNVLSYALCYQVSNCAIQRCREKYFQVINNFLN